MSGGRAEHRSYIWYIKRTQQHFSLYQQCSSFPCTQRKDGQQRRRSGRSKWVQEVLVGLKHSQCKGNWNRHPVLFSTNTTRSKYIFGKKLGANSEDWDMVFVHFPLAHLHCSRFSVLYFSVFYSGCRCQRVTASPEIRHLGILIMDNYFWEQPTFMVLEVTWLSNFVDFWGKECWKAIWPQVRCCNQPRIMRTFLTKFLASKVGKPIFPVVLLCVHWKTPDFSAQLLWCVLSVSVGETWVIWSRTSCLIRKIGTHQVKFFQNLFFLFKSSREINTGEIGVWFPQNLELSGNSDNPHSD